jgi:hypothetical protein
MAKPIETLSPTDEAIFRTATLKSLQGAAEDPDRIGAEFMPANAVVVSEGLGVRYFRVNDDNSISELSATQLLSDLTPNRILFVDDLPASWFNGTSNDTITTIPLTAGEAVVGTKIRLRGFVKVGFQGIFPEFGGDCSMLLAINVAASSANPLEGVIFVLNFKNSQIFHVDAEIELKTAGSGLYKAGVPASQVFHCLAVTTGALPARAWDEAGTSLVVLDPTTAETVGSTAGLVVQLQAVGGEINQSLCNVWVDLAYEVVAP